ncbi:MAG: homocysteine S-methyltransferase family protein, partial [Gemmatimonadota bacterium]
MPDVRETLDSDRVLLLDGAMGTELYRRGVFVNRCYDALSVDEPELVRDIHRDYRRAGAELLETNTFGGNRMRLQSYGEEERVDEINRAAARLARDVAGDELLVGGSMGPLGVRLEPYGPTSEAEARDIFREQAELLAEGGVDLLILETFSDLSELEQAVAACEALSLPVLAQMTIQPDGRTSYGVEPEQIAAAMEEAGADAVGLNCSVGPAGMLEAVERMAESTRLPVSAVPNAGLPQEVEGRKMYMASPEYMATYARRLVESGARMVGGCCGTGPDHVREMARQLEEAHPRPRAAVRTSAEPAAPDPDEPDEEWIDRRLSASRPNVTVVGAAGPGDYALELLVYCPDQSCQPVHT